jgi:hypothetical protein
MALPVQVATKFAFTATPEVDALGTDTVGVDATVVAVAAKRSMCCDVATYRYSGVTAGVGVGDAAPGVGVADANPDGRAVGVGVAPGTPPGPGVGVAPARAGVGVGVAEATGVVFTPPSLHPATSDELSKRRVAAYVPMRMAH